MSSVFSAPGTPIRSSSLPTSAPSSPPDLTMEDEPKTFATAEEKALFDEEKKAQAENERAEERRRKLAAKKRKQVQESEADRKAKAKQLDELLTKSAAFSDILTKKTEVLGRVGSGFDGKALGEHDLVMATQPKCMIGGTMRDYQLEGLTWMYEICSQGMSGILADEMGLGKTIQTISVVGKLREENCFGPHLIVAPLSTLSNWQEEFTKWVPSIPVAFFHGTPPHRKQVFKNQLMKHYKGNKASDKFPVVLTTPEMVMRDAADLSKIKWDFVYIDEGHRLKNFDSKLFRTLRSHFDSTTRFLITGTPLQNNLKELWSLLNFLLPNIFTYWEQFESWFDFSELQDEEGTEEFLEDKAKQDLIKKMHLILQPLLLRRIKADVEHLLPKKREYILYAPMTKDQTDLYNAINDRNIDTRQFLENKVVERLTGTTNTPLTSRRASPTSTTKTEDSDSEDIPLAKLALKRSKAQPTKPETPKNAFQQMMQRQQPPTLTAGKKRKSTSSLPIPAPKSAKSSRSSTPASTTLRGRKARKPKTYQENYPSDEDALSDDEFEEMIAEELTSKDEISEIRPETEEEIQLAKTLELAKKEISHKKLGNPLMQLRLACNSPHNFYNPWSSTLNHPIDTSLITSSGKMLLLDRLLPHLFASNHKVLIFSQFTTQLNLLEDYARELKGWSVCRIDGSVAQEIRQEQIREFNTNPEFKLFLLSTRAGGQGINLAAADTVILFDSDFNPQLDLQAQDRAHRIGQKNPVIVFRLATKGTVEEELLMSADAKRRLEKLVIKKGGFRNLGQKLKGEEEGMSREVLKSLLLRDGEVWKWREGEGVLDEEDLRVLCDRSESAYGEKGDEGEKWKRVETKVGGLMVGVEKGKGKGRK